MSANSAIEWTDATWNPVTGCTKVSPGCDHCYAETFAERWRGTAGHYFTNGFDVTLRPDKLNLPLTWRKPKRVFVNSMSDLFHDDVPLSFIERVFSVMARTPQHTYQILTKRHARMSSILRRPTFPATVNSIANADVLWPLPNVWLGVSVEDQKWADIRIPALLDTPAAVRFLSCEPLLGPVDLTPWMPCARCGARYPLPEAYDDDLLCDCQEPRAGVIDWVIAGGESGPGARPMHPDWARSLRDQCAAAGVPYFFKQWGEWAPNGWRGIGNFNPKRELLVGEPLDDAGHREVIERVGKKAAGRELDGRTWDEYPQATAVAR